MPCKPTVDEYEKNHHKVLVLRKDAEALSMQIKSTLESQIKGTSPAASSVQIAWAYHLLSKMQNGACREKCHLQLNHVQGIQGDATQFSPFCGCDGGIFLLAASVRSSMFMAGLMVPQTMFSIRARSGAPPHPQN